MRESLTSAALCVLLSIKDLGHAPRGHLIRQGENAAKSAFSLVKPKENALFAKFDKGGRKG